MLYIQAIVGNIIFYTLSSTYGQSVLTVPKNYRKTLLLRGFIGFYGTVGLWGAI